MERNVTTDDAVDGPTDSGRRRRAGYALVGGTLAALGAKRRSLAGTAVALAGGALAYRGLKRRGTPDSRDDAFLEESEMGAGDADASTVTSSVTVGVSADEAYEAWRDPETRSRVFGAFADVTEVDGDRQRWTVDAPLGRAVTWESRITDDRPGELVRWESVGGPAVVSEGSVRFSPAPADRGTEVTLRLRIDPPGGSLGRAAMERLDVLPKALANKMLYRYKSLVETGEIPTLERNPSGRGRGDLL